MAYLNKKEFLIGLILISLLMITICQYYFLSSSTLKSTIINDKTEKIVNLKESLYIDINETWDSGGNDYCKDIAIDTNGSIYLVGSTSYSGNSDSLIIKYNSNGDYQWNRTWGGNSDDFGYGIEIDSFNNIYVTGYTSSYGQGGTDIFLLKYNSMGIRLWNYTYGHSDFDLGFGISKDLSDNIFISGVANYTGPDTGVMVLLKYDSNGIFQWKKVWDGISSDAAYDVTVDSSENIYLVGVTQFGGLESGLSNITLIKYNSSGDFQWERIWGKKKEDVAFSVSTDASGNVYIGGYTENYGVGSYDMLLLKYDSSGSYQWNKTWGGIFSDKCNDLAIDSEGDIYITGYSESYGAPGIESLSIIAFRNSGYQKWNWTWNTFDSVAGEGIKFDQYDNCYIALEKNQDALFFKFSFKPGSFTLFSDNAGTPDIDGVFNLNWTASFDSDNYSVYMHDSFITDINDTITELATEITDLSFPISGLTNGTYYFKIVAFNQYGNSSSNCISVEVKLYPPRTFLLFSGDVGTPDLDGAFNLNWTTSIYSDNYSVYMHDSFITDINDTITELATEITDLSFHISGLTNGTYYFKIAAFNQYGNSSSNCLIVEVRLLPPGSFILFSSDADTPDMDGAFSLNWTTSDYSNNYSIYMHTSLITEINGSLTEIAIEITDLSYSISGLTDGEYYFIVVAHNEYGTKNSNCLHISVNIPKEKDEGDTAIIITIIIVSSVAGAALIGVGIYIIRRRK